MNGRWGRTGGREVGVAEDEKVRKDEDKNRKERVADKDEGAGGEKRRWREEGQRQ